MGTPSRGNTDRKYQVEGTWMGTTSGGNTDRKYQVEGTQMGTTSGGNPDGKSRVEGTRMGTPSGGNKDGLHSPKTRNVVHPNPKTLEDLEGSNHVASKQVIEKKL
ncbi:hypothetical protein L6452_18176 [Arctium lappa]|uniref:Uncharacterized protein n=1 Tax=Arctium lappa TaxID=4217 RepID=A0ACB9C5F2_ARCLA|nr:hypothetical protein L6452_18176 [Arctium lappa]